MILTCGWYMKSLIPREDSLGYDPHKERPRVAERLLTTLRMHGIDILSTNNASSVISCVLKAEYVEQALACLADVFELP